MKKPPSMSPTDIQAMKETLIVLGTKSEQYYETCSDEQIIAEYDKLGVS